jgi:hypothetical protein
MSSGLRVRTNRIRRVAKRRGYRVEKCRRRDALALDYGTYQLVSEHVQAPPVVGSFSLEALEKFLGIPQKTP